MTSLETWIQRYVGGDREAFEPIHAHYRKRLWAYLCSKIGNRNDAEDLFSQVSMTVARKLPDLREVHKLDAWVIGIAANHLRDYYDRGKANTVNLDDLVEEPMDEEPSCERNIISKEALCQVHSCIRGLPSPQRDFLELHYLAEMSHKEVAAHFRISISALKSQVFRAKLKLIACLKQHGVIDPVEQASRIRSPEHPLTSLKTC